MQISPQRGRTRCPILLGGTFCVYTAVLNSGFIALQQLSCAVLLRYCAVLCGAVLLSYCRSAVLELQHELLHHGLHYGVKQWVYTSVATKLCCTVALLCGAVLLCYCSSPVLDLQHELLRRIEEKASRFSAGMNPTLPFTLHQSMAQRDIPR